MKIIKPVLMVCMVKIAAIGAEGGMGYTVSEIGIFGPPKFGTSSTAVTLTSLDVSDSFTTTTTLAPTTTTVSLSAINAATNLLSISITTTTTTTSAARSSPSVMVTVTSITVIQSTVTESGKSPTSISAAPSVMNPLAALVKLVKALF